MEIILGIARHKEIELPVPIVITKRRTCRPHVEGDSRFLSDVGEGAVMVVVVKAILANVRYIEVGPTIVVVICDRYADSPAIVRYTGSISKICEGSIVVVLKERCVYRGCFAVHGVVREAVDQVNIHPTIVVVIQQRNASTERLYYRGFCRRATLIPPGG